MDKELPNSYRIYLSPPFLNGKEATFINEALQSNWVATEGHHIDAFANALSDFLDGRHVVLLNTGTAALHLACVLLNVEAGDYVLCQDFSFIATANPVLYQKGIPVLIDSERDTWNMDPASLEEGIRYCIQKGKKPKAIIYAHIYGMPARIEEIMKLARQYEIPVIEDAAEALGSVYYGQHAGLFGDISILSFNGNKIMTSAGGGALATSDPRIAQKAKYLAAQAKRSQPGYVHDDVGYNYGMSNILAAMGRAQWSDIRHRVELKRKIFDYYYKHLHQEEQITFQSEPTEVTSNRWLTCLQVNDKEALERMYRKFSNSNIEVRPLWKPIHMQQPYGKCLLFGENNANNFYQNGICLPSGLQLSTGELEEICECIKASF